MANDRDVSWFSRSLFGKLEAVHWKAWIALSALMALVLVGELLDSLLMSYLTSHGKAYLHYPIMAPLGIGLLALCYWLAGKVERYGHVREAPLMTVQASAVGEEREVPVQSLFVGRTVFLFFGWSARTDFGPRLWITPSGLRFKIFREGMFPFADVEQVDVRTPWMSMPRVLIIGDRNRRILSACMANMDAARRLIAALPADLPLSAEAATLRDGHPGAAAKGLRRYLGAIR